MVGGHRKCLESSKVVGVKIWGKCKGGVVWGSKKVNGVKILGKNGVGQKNHGT